MMRRGSWVSAGLGAVVGLVVASVLGYCFYRNYELATGADATLRLVLDTETSEMGLNEVVVVKRLLEARMRFRAAKERWWGFPPEFVEPGLEVVRPASMNAVSIDGNILGIGDAGEIAIIVMNHHDVIYSSTVADGDRLRFFVFRPNEIQFLDLAELDGMVIGR